jgi:hypothetical protein
VIAFSASVVFSLTFSTFWKRFPLRSLFVLRNRKNSLGAGSGEWGGGVRNRCHPVLREKLPHTQCCVGGSVVVMKPLTWPQQVGAFSSHRITQSLEHFEVKLLVNILTYKTYLLKCDNYGRGKIYFFPPRRPDPLRDPPCLLLRRYRKLLLRRQNFRVVKLITYIHLRPRLKMPGVVTSLPLTPSWHAIGYIYLHFTASVIELSGHKTKLNAKITISSRVLRLSQRYCRYNSCTGQY